MRSMSVEAGHLGDGRAWCKQAWGEAEEKTPLPLFVITWSKTTEKVA
jgi:hypothetical protein